MPKLGPFAKAWVEHLMAVYGMGVEMITYPTLVRRTGGLAPLSMIRDVARAREPAVAPAVLADAVLAGEARLSSAAGLDAPATKNKYPPTKWRRTERDAADDEMRSVLLDVAKSLRAELQVPDPTSGEVAAAVAANSASAEPLNVEAHLARLVSARSDVCLINACVAIEQGDAVVTALVKLHAKGLLTDDKLVERLAGVCQK
jgi:hypothetical protein